MYEPEHLDGKVPAVLNVLGHFPNGKSMLFEQKLCINQALRGMVSLSMAFIGMGELRMEGNEHYFSADLSLVGVNGAGLLYLAMRRGLDRILQRRAEGFESCPLSIGCPGSTEVRPTPVFLVRDAAGEVHLAGPWPAGGSGAAERTRGPHAGAGGWGGDG